MFDYIPFDGNKGSGEDIELSKVDLVILSNRINALRRSQKERE
jgi:hypothetical protein